MISSKLSPLVRFVLVGPRHSPTTHVRAPYDKEEAI
jgi:hypothetical protein